MTTTKDVYAELCLVFDPEIPVNIVDLGLIYEVKIDGKACHIKMTLTSQACPEARTIPEVMKRRVLDLDGVDTCEIDIVWEPMWTPQLITPEGRQLLGLDEAPAPTTPPAGEPEGAEPTA